jgi:hypothetical protein
MNGSAVSGPDLRGTVLVILFCFPMTSAAQAVERPRLVEELLTGERVTLQDEKELEASFGFDDRSLSALETLTLTLRLEYGISERLQVEVEAPWARLKIADSTQAGLGDLEIGALFGIVTSLEPWALSAGVRVHVSSGSHSGNPGGDDWAVEPTLLTAMTLGAGQVQASASWSTEPSAPRWSFHAALIEPWRAWRGVLEIEASEKGSSTLTPGVIWHVPALEVGIGCPLGLSHDAPSGVIVKVTKEFQF